MELRLRPGVHVVRRRNDRLAEPVNRTLELQQRGIAMILVKQFRGEVVKADQETGTVIAVVNTGGVKDRQGDDLAYGAWSKVIREGQQPAIIWSHNVQGL